MPQITVYIKDEDMELWKALPSKAGAIRDMLHGTSITKPTKAESEEVNHDMEYMKSLPIGEQVEMMGYKWDPTVKKAWDESNERYWPVVVMNGLVEVMTG